MKALKLKTKKNITLLALLGTDEKVYEYAVVSDYDETKHFGEQWNNGHYFFDILEATYYFHTTYGRPHFHRLDEIASNALHYIEDVHNELLEFEMDANLDLTDEELLYFGLDAYF